MDLDEFPAENKEKTVNSMVGAHRAESTDKDAAGGVTPKIPLTSFETRYLLEVLHLLQQRRDNPPMHT